MPNLKHHPKLSTIVTSEAIPGDIEAIESLAQEGIEILLGDMRYANYIVEHSPDGDTVFYSLTILGKELILPVFRTGLQLIFFEGNIANYSNFPITIDWRWPIQRYFQGFEKQGFAYTPEAFTNILLGLADIESDEAFLEDIVNVFFISGTTPYKKVLDEVENSFERLRDNWNSNQSVKNKLQTILNEVEVITAQIKDRHQNGDQLIDIARTFNDDNIINGALNNIQTTFNELETMADIDIDIYQIFLDALLLEITDINEKLDRLFTLFSGYLGNITKEDIEYLLIPQFSIELQNIDMALEFPRNWLQPIDPATNEVYTTDKKSSLSFNVSSLQYSTQTGFHFQGENSLSFTKSVIGETGLTLEIQRMKLDLSHKTNIPEATADGRPEDFMGAYIQLAVIGLPQKWFGEDSGATLGVFGYNLIFGTGGITGNIGLGALPTKVATLKEVTELTNGTEIRFIKQNANIEVGDPVVYEDDQDQTVQDGNYTLSDDEGEITIRDGKLLNFLPPDTELFFTLGKKDPGSTGPRKGFRIGFKEFKMVWQQNALIESSVKGSLYFPKFERCEKDAASGTWSKSSDPLYVGIEALFERNGDFQITAKPAGTEGVSFCLDGVFIVTIDSLEVGKEEDRVYLCISGALCFDNNPRLKDVFEDEIEIENMYVYSDGSIEFGGGQIPLPKSAKLKLGPTEVAITSLSFGSEEKEHNGLLRKYNFFEFGFGLSAGTIGLDLKGDGCAYYFTTDNGTAPGYDPHRFFRISGIGINLVIPATAPKGKAAVIIEGYLSIKEDNYKGKASLELPNMNVKGGVEMELWPDIPAWIVSAHLQFPGYLPLAASGIGINEFKVLVGKRYVAAKEAVVGLTAESRWFDYYKADQGSKGIHIDKMLKPDKTENAKAPFSVGAGLTMGTMADDSYSFSLQAFLLLSLPNLIFIEGKGNILGEKAGLVTDDAKFFAFVAFEPGNSIEFGLGAQYLQRGDGKLIKVDAEVEAAYFMQNKSAGYIHIGDKENPITARILSLFNAYSYLMLSASGIEAGAGVRFGFSKKYGPVRAKVAAYIDIYGKLSFQGPQLGANFALGGQVDISVFGIGLGIRIATTLQATIPKPFRIAGKVEIHISINLLLKKFEKRFHIDFIWLKDSRRDDTPIWPLEEPGNGESDPVAALHIGSGHTYAVNYLGNNNGNVPNVNDIDAVLPVDSYINIQSKKPLNANAVSDKLGGITNAPVGSIDRIPPKPSWRDVQHEALIEEFEIKAWNGSNWVDYHPYEAIWAGQSVPAGINMSDFKYGHFQKNVKEYSNFQLMAQSPLSYMDSASGEYIPEQMGITSATLFCKDKERSWHCARWKKSEIFRAGQWYHHQELKIEIRHKDMQVMEFRHGHDIPNALCIPIGGQLIITLPAKSLKAELKLFTFAKSVDIQFMVNEFPIVDGFQQYREVERRTLSPAQLYQPLNYDSPDEAIDRIIITPASVDQEAVKNLKLEIEQIEAQLYNGGDESAQLEQLRAEKLQLLKESQDSPCSKESKDAQKRQEELEAAIAERKSELANCEDQKEELQEEKEQACRACKEIQSAVTDCLSKMDQHLKDCDLTDCIREIREKLESGIFTNTTLSPLQLKKLEREMENCQEKIDPKLLELQSELTRQLQQCQEKCREIEDRLKDTEQNSRTLQKRIELLESYLESNEKLPEVICPCGTLLQEVCWMTEEDIYYNQTIPGQDAVEEDYQLSKAALENTPLIWRPNTTYYVRMRVADRIDSGTPKRQDIYFGFKTAGPIGLFPEDQIPNTDTSGSTNGFDDQVVSAETSLKFYIDFHKSYPIPNSKLIDQKQLYYKNPKINLFYTKNFTRQFFADWGAYNGLPPLNGKIEIEIKDPVEGQVPQTTASHQAPVFTAFPQANVSWEDDPDPIVPESVQVYNNLRHPEINNPNYSGQRCWGTGGDPIVPASKKTTIEAEDLKPLKLYNVIVKNNFQGASKAIHNYVIRTSRFGDFSEHINSYHLKDKDGNTRDAVYRTSIKLGTTLVEAHTDIDEAFNMVLNQPNNLSSRNKSLATTYADPFQRLTEGHFHLEPPHPTLGLSFDFIEESRSGKVIALLISSIEPLNDPRMPFDVLRSTIQVQENGFYRYDYFPLFSQDGTKIILMNYARNIATTDLRIHFYYKQWDGQQYATLDDVLTDNLIF